MPLPSRMVATLIDEKGSSSTVSLNVVLPSALTMTNVQEIGERWAEDLDNVTGCQIVAVAMMYEVDLTDPGLNLKFVADAGSDIEEGARFSFGTPSGFVTEFRIPGFLESLITAGTRTVNILAPAVVEILTDVISGIGYGLGVDVDASDNRGEDISRLQSAVEQFVRSRVRRF